jgi:hypothetical protein
MLKTISLPSYPPKPDLSILFTRSDELRRKRQFTRYSIITDDIRRAGLTRKGLFLDMICTYLDEQAHKKRESTEQVREIHDVLLYWSTQNSINERLISIFLCPITDRPPQQPFLDQILLKSLEIGSDLFARVYTFGSTETRTHLDSLIRKYGPVFDTYIDTLRNQNRHLTFRQLTAPFLPHPLISKPVISTPPFQGFTFQFPGQDSGTKCHVFEGDYIGPLVDIKSDLGPTEFKFERGDIVTLGPDRPTTFIVTETSYRSPHLCQVVHLGDNGLCQHSFSLSRPGGYPTLWIIRPTPEVGLLMADLAQNSLRAYRFSQQRALLYGKILPKKSLTLQTFAKGLWDAERNFPIARHRYFRKEKYCAEFALMILQQSLAKYSLQEKPLSYPTPELPFESWMSMNHDQLSSALTFIPPQLRIKPKSAFPTRLVRLFRDLIPEPITEGTITPLLTAS